MAISLSLEDISEIARPSEIEVPSTVVVDVSLFETKFFHYSFSLYSILVRPS